MFRYHVPTFIYVNKSERDLSNLMLKLDGQPMTGTRVKKLSDKGRKNTGFYNQLSDKGNSDVSVAIERFPDQTFLSGFSGVMCGTYEVIISAKENAELSVGFRDIDK